MPPTRRGSFTDFDDSDDVSDDYSSVSSRGTGQSSASSGGDDQSSSSHNDGLGLRKNEGCAIRASRVLFFTFLLIAAGFLGWVVYHVTRNDEVEDFESTVGSVPFVCLLLCMNLNFSLYLRRPL